MLTIVHGSDVHFGVPHLPEVAQLFADAVESLAPDLLVVSGDLTQRAKVHEYAAAAEWLARFGEIPVVVTPGNHDVPLYRVFERLFDPYRNWRRHISKSLDSVTRIPGAVVVALNSAAPHRAIVNGRIRAHQLRYAREAFSDAAEGEVRILVVHHHLVPAPDHESDHPIPGAPALLREFESMGVDVILSGHLHRAYVGSSIDAAPGPGPRARVLAVHSGTTTSSRGRARERGRNSYNLLRIDDQVIEVVPHLLDPEAGRFAPTALHRFPRHPLVELPVERDEPWRPTPEASR